MEVSTLQLPPGDPGLIDKIVYQLKSNGIFDQFRKECIADVDTKPAYQNLRQRVEGSVSSFLSNQEWKPDLNKNQLRDSLRKNIHESGFLDIGVERIVDQVVNPKIYTVFFPKVEDVVYGFLGVEKPKKGVDIPNGLRESAAKFDEPPKQEKKFVSLKDLLPTDLDPISPEKFDSDEDIGENSPDRHKHSDISVFDQNNSQRIKVKEEINSDIELDHDEDERDDEDDDDDEDSPPFESLENDALDPTSSPPLLPLHSADMLDNITSSSSSSETKDLLQYGEVRKRYPEVKPDPIKMETNGEAEKYVHPESIKTEPVPENFTVKKEEKEKKESLEVSKDWKKFERKEEKNRDSSERKDEARSRKSGEPKDKHGHEKKRSEKDQVVIKSEKDDSKKSEKEDQRKTVKEEHRKSDKDEHKKSEKDEHKKSEKEEYKKGNKDEHRKSEKGDHKKSEKDEHKKNEKEEMKKDEVRKSEKGEKKHSEKVDKERDSSKRHDREKEDRKSTKEKDEKERRREKEESKRGEKDDYKKAEKEKDDKVKSDRERSDSKKRDKKDEKKSEKEDKKVSKDRDDSKKSDKEDTKRPEKDESSKKLEKEKHRSSKEKTDHSKIDKETKERVKNEHKDKEAKHGSSKSSTESSKKENNEKDHHSKLQVDKKKEDKAKKSHHPDSSKNNSSKDKKVVDKEKKVSASDDHRHEKVKGKDGHRRSDRDKDRERERSQADGTTHTTLGKDGGGQSSTSSTPSSEGSKGNGDSSSGSGGSERAKEGETKVKNTERKEETSDKKINEVLSPISNATPGNLAMKIKKPKIAANIYEVKKIIQVRKNLKKLERERMASSYANKVSCQKTDEAPAESASRLEDLSETETSSEPPKVKRAKLGAVEQDLRVEVESVLEKGLLDDEDGDIGAVHYLENDSNLNDFVLYVRGLEEEVAMGDYSRVPSPTNSVTTAELSDFEDNVILSDVELSKEEEDVVTRLGGFVERKTANLKSPKKTSTALSSLEISSEGCNKRPRRPNPRYSSGEFTVYSDDDDDVDDDMMETISHKKGALVDGVDIEQRKTPKEKESGEDDADAIGNGAALPTPENDAGSEDRETPVLSKRNQGAVEERRKFGKRLGVRGPLRRFAGFSPGTPDNFVMPLSPESDVSTASGDAGKKASLNTKALENQYHQDVDGELGPEDFDDVKGSEDVDKHSRLPLGPPLSGDGRSQASELHHVHNDMGQSSSVLMDGDQSGFVSRRLRGTRSSVRVQQRYSSDDLYKPRPNITLGRRNRGRNSPTQDESSTPDSAFLKQGRRGSSQGTEELLNESCPPNKRRRRDQRETCTTVSNMSREHADEALLKT